MQALVAEVMKSAPPEPEPAVSPATRHGPAAKLGVYSRYAWTVLIYTLAVILFGAWVRVSGSGDGCGDHWPSCHGQLVPQAETTKTWIEYSHRVSSGLLGPMVLALVAWGWRISRFWTGSRPVRWFAWLTLLFVLIEAGIGALLVRGRLVAEDDSVARAIVVGLHLANTLMLTAVTALTAWFSQPRSWPGISLSPKPLVPRARPSQVARWLLAALVLTVLISATGAVTALGDTLFPVSPTQESGLFARLRDDLDAGAHFLVRLRVVHPVLAVLVGLGIGYGCQKLFEQPGETGKLARWAYWTVWIQMAMGAFNIALGAPGWMQLLHLLLAQVMWLLLVLLFFSHQADFSSATGGKPA